MLLRSSGQPSSQDRHSYRIGITEVGLDSCVVPVAMRLLAFSLIGMDPSVPAAVGHGVVGPQIPGGIPLLGPARISHSLR